MKSFRIFSRGIAVNALLSLALVAAAAGAKSSPPVNAATTAPPAKGYDAYRLVRTRNIFDPARREYRPSEPQARPQPTANRPGYLGLTGTMVTDRRALAFFTGSRSEHNKVLELRQPIADYTVTSITPTQVDLERNGRKFTIAVGQRLAVDDSGTVTDGPPPPIEAAPAVPAAPAAPGSVSTSTPSTQAAPGAAPPVSADKAEILRRMMERRQKEISR